MEVPVTFPVGSITLEGLLSLPAEATRVGVVVCHPHPLHGGEMHNNVVSALVDAVQRAGLATLRFNFRGVGKSQGLHDDGNGEVDDVKGAVSFLLSRRWIPSIAVAGYSFGSIVGLKAGAEDARVSKLVGVALPIANRDATFLEGVTKPKLLISGDRDDYAPVAKLQRLTAAMPEPKALVVIDGADHFFSGDEGRVAAAVAAFLKE